jgi:uncharacterized protein YkwD
MNKRKTKPKSKKASKPVVIIPTKHHTYVRVILVILALFIFLFNTFVKVDVSAQNTNSSINIQNLLVAHNNYRKSLGLGELKLSTELNRSAQSKAQVLLQSNCWSHYCPPGKSPWDFFVDAKYDYVFAGENLAEGFYEVEDVMTAWINSKTHKENMVKKEYTEVGFGIVTGKYQGNSNNVIIVVHFGSRAPNAVLSQNSRDIKIVNPVDGSVVTEPIANITGSVAGIDKVNIISNNILQGEAGITDGIFTYRLNNLAEGDNEIYADGLVLDTSISSNKIRVSYKPEVSDANSIITTSSQTKNMFNLGFVGLLALIFLVDFILVSRTQALKNFKSFSHYHFVLFIIIGGVIIIGGFAGQIGTSLSV